MASSILLPVITSARVACVFRPYVNEHLSRDDHHVEERKSIYIILIFEKCTILRSIVTILVPDKYRVCIMKMVYNGVSVCMGCELRTEDRGDPSAGGTQKSCDECWHMKNITLS